MFIPLHSCTNQELLEKYICIEVATTKSADHAVRPMQLSSETEVSILLLCQLCSTHYTAVQIKNCLKAPL